MATPYVLTDVASDLTTQAADHNRKALDAAQGGTGLSVSLSGGGSGSFAWYTEPGEPGLAEWPAGSYIFGFDVDAAGADITYSLILRRVNSSGATVETLGSLTDQSGTGLKELTVNVGSPITTGPGDRLVGIVEATRAASHGNQTLTISVNGANDRLVGAWEAAGQQFQASFAATAVGVAAMTRHAEYRRAFDATALGVPALARRVEWCARRPIVISQIGAS